MAVCSVKLKEATPPPPIPPLATARLPRSLPADAKVPGPPHRHTIASRGHTMADACVDHGGNARPPPALPRLPSPSPDRGAAP